MTTNVTPAQLKAAFAMTAAVAEAIRELKQIPSGELYARLMTKVDLAGYQGIIRTLKGAGLISETANLLRWTGPEITKEAA